MSPLIARLKCSLPVARGLVSSWTVAQLLRTEAHDWTLLLKFGAPCQS